MRRVFAVALLISVIGWSTASAAPKTTVAEDVAATQIQLALERSVDGGKSWITRSSLTVRSAVPASMKARPCALTNTCPLTTTITSSPVAETLENEAQRNALLGVERLLYRIVGTAPENAEEFARVALSPCSIVRGFEPRTSKHIVLQEQFKLLVKATTSGSASEGPEIAFLGLQHQAPVNLHHSSASGQYSSTKGGECDFATLALFPTVTVETTVGLTGPNTPLRVPDASSAVPVMIGGKAASPEEAAAALKAAAGGSGVGDSKEGEKKKEEEKSFFEKYSTYILIGGAMFMMSMRGAPPAEAAKGGAAAAAVAGGAPAKK